MPELVDAARDSIIVGHIRALVSLLEGGRPLTDRGNLKLADARALAKAIGREDEFDQPEGFKTFTSREVPSVDLAFCWARSAKLIRVAKGVASPTRRGRALGADPLGDIWVLFGPFVRRLRWTERRYTVRGAPYYARDLWDQLPNLLGLALQQGRLDLTFVAGDFAMWVTEEFDFSDATEKELDNLPGWVAADLWQTVFCPLGELGVFELTRFAPPFSDADVRDEERTAALTPLGRWAVRRLLDS